jgi:TP901 family phage tail tape measure protein
LIGNLNLTKTRQAIKAQLKGLNNNMSFNITPTVNMKGVQTATKNAVNNAQNVANRNKIKVGFDVDKQKLINQIKILGQQNSKLFSNSEITAKYNQLLDSAKIAKSKSEVKALRSELSAFKTELVATSNSGMNWIDKFKASISHVSQYVSSATFIYTLTNQLREAYEQAVNLDTAFTDLINVQKELSKSDYSSYLAEVNKTAKELATTQQALIEGATEFSRSGYDKSESDELAKISAVFANVGEMEASDAAKAIIAGVQAYSEIDGYTDTIEKANALIDKYNLVGDEASITSEEIAEGVERVGSVFADSNTSIDQLISMLAAGNRTIQDADSLSLGLRTSALRIRSCTTELEAMGEETDTVCESTSKLQEKIKALTDIDGSGGVNILEADGETFRSIYDIYLDISKVYQRMSDVDKSSLLELIAGKNRSFQISSVLNNMSEAQELYEKSLNATGSAQEEYEKYLSSTQAAQNRLNATLTETYQTILNGGTVTNILNCGNAVLEFANSLGLVEGTLKGLIALGLGKFLTTSALAFVQVTKSVEKYGKAIQVANNVQTQGNLAQRFSSLKQIAQLTQNLTTAQLKEVLSSQALTQQDRIRILMMQGMTKEMALQKLEEMNLTSATNAQTAANAASTASTFSLKAAMIGLQSTLKSVFLSNPAGITLMAISVGVSALTTAISNNNQKLEESREKAKEAADEADELGDEIAELAQKYIQLSDAVKTDQGSKEDLLSVQEELIKKLGIEGETLMT